MLDRDWSLLQKCLIGTGRYQGKMLDRDWSLSGKNGRSGLVAMVYVVATRGKLLKGTSREQAFLQKRPVAIKHFCERDQSRSQITTSNYKLRDHDKRLRQNLSYWAEYNRNMQFAL